MCSKARPQTTSVTGVREPWIYGDHIVVPAPSVSSSLHEHGAPGSMSLTASIGVVPAPNPTTNFNDDTLAPLGRSMSLSNLAALMASDNEHPDADGFPEARAPSDDTDSTGSGTSDASSSSPDLDDMTRDSTPGDAGSPVSFPSDAARYDDNNENRRVATSPTEAEAEAAANRDETPPSSLNPAQTVHAGGVPATPAPLQDRSHAPNVQPVSASLQQRMPTPTPAPLTFPAVALPAADQEHATTPACQPDWLAAEAFRELSRESGPARNLAITAARQALKRKWVQCADPFVRGRCILAPCHACCVPSSCKTVTMDNVATILCRECAMVITWT